MTPTEPAEVIEAHRLWMAGEGGSRADLSGADLSGASARVVLATALQGSIDREAIVGELLDRSLPLAGGTIPGTSPSSSDTGGEP